MVVQREQLLVAIGKLGGFLINDGRAVQAASSPLRASGLPMNMIQGEHFPVTSSPCSSLSSLRIGDFIVVPLLPILTVTGSQMILGGRFEKIDVSPE